MKKARYTHLFVIIRIVAGMVMSCLPLFLPSKAAAQNSALAPMVGTWQVVAVRLDETLTRTPFYNYDDNRLVGRTLNICNKTIQTDMPEKSTCTGPKARLVESTADMLVQESMGRHKGGNKVTAVDFDLPVEGSQKVQVLWIGCEKGDIGLDTPFGPEGQNWAAMLPEEQLAMRWYDNTILLLKKVPQNMGRAKGDRLL